MLKYFFSVLLLTIAVCSFSQEKKSDKKMLWSDTLKHKFDPTGVRIGVDAISIIKSHVTNNFTGWEVNADVDFYRYYLAVDYGSWSRNFDLTNGLYKNDGTYYRIGSDVNFMLKDVDKNMFFLGLRYGHSSFTESLNYHYNDSLPGVTSTNLVTENLSNVRTAHWIEITAGLRIKVWGPFWMGYTARLKLGPKVNGTGSFHSFDIPGYGLAEKSSYWGINYQLFWRIPLPKRD